MKKVFEKEGGGWRGWRPPDFLIRKYIQSSRSKKFCKKRVEGGEGGELPAERSKNLNYSNRSPALNYPRAGVCPE